MTAVQEVTTDSLVQNMTQVQRRRLVGQFQVVTYCSEAEAFRKVSYALGEAIDTTADIDQEALHAVNSYVEDSRTRIAKYAGLCDCNVTQCHRSERTGMQGCFRDGDIAATVVRTCRALATSNTHSSERWKAMLFSFAREVMAGEEGSLTDAERTAAPISAELRNQLTIHFATLDKLVSAAASKKHFAAKLLVCCGELAAADSPVAKVSRRCTCLSRSAFLHTHESACL